MTADSKKTPKKRAKLLLDGEEVSEAETNRNIPLSLDQLLNQDAKTWSSSPFSKLLEIETTWPREKILALELSGRTLADEVGFKREEQLEVAKLGYTLLEAERYAEAQTIFLALFRANPRDSYFRLVLGSIAQREKKFEDADIWYSGALLLDPLLPSAWANRGEVRMELGRLDEAKSDLEQALRCDPEAKNPAVQRAKITLSILLKQTGSE